MIGNLPNDHNPYFQQAGKLFPDNGLATIRKTFYRKKMLGRIYNVRNLQSRIGDFTPFAHSNIITRTPEESKGEPAVQVQLIFSRFSPIFVGFQPFRGQGCVRCIFCLAITEKERMCNLLRDKGLHDRFRTRLRSLGRLVRIPARSSVRQACRTP